MERGMFYEEGNRNLSIHSDNPEMMKFIMCGEIRDFWNDKQSVLGID